jgi:hypothetical protein
MPLLELESRLPGFQSGVLTINTIKAIINKHR